MPDYKFTGDELTRLAHKAEELVLKVESLKKKIRVILYGSYLPSKEGINFLENVKNELIKRGYTQTLLVKDIEGKIRRTYNIDQIISKLNEEIRKKVKNFLVSINSFYYGDFLIFIFTKVPLALHLSGVLIELCFYIQLNHKLSDKHALVMVERELESKVSSLFIGMLEYYKHKLYYSYFDDLEDCVEIIDSFIAKRLEEICVEEQNCFPHQHYCL